MIGKLDLHVNQAFNVNQPDRVSQCLILPLPNQYNMKVSGKFDKNMSNVRIA